MISGVPDGDIGKTESSFVPENRAIHVPKAATTHNTKNKITINLLFVISIMFPILSKGCQHHQRHLPEYV